MHHLVKIILIVIALIISITSTVKSKKTMDACGNSADAKAAYGTSLTVTILLVLLLIWCLVMHGKEKGYSLSSLSNYL